MKRSKRTSSNRKNSPTKTTRDIVQRHLSDKEDKITEDDFKNLSLPDAGIEPLPIEEGKERPKDSDKDNDTLTPWDVISE